MLNPLYREYPQWQPEVLPGQRMVDGTAFTLEELSEDNGQLSKELLGHIPHGIPTCARLRMTRSGEPDRDWDVCGAQFRDATANRVSRIPVSTPRSGPGEVYFYLACPFFKGENAVKLGVALVRKSQIDSNEVFVVKGVPLQAGRGASSTFHYTNTLVGRVGVTVGSVTTVAVSTTLESRTTNVLKQFSISVYSLEPRLKDIFEPRARWFLPLEAKDDLGRTFGFTGYKFDALMPQRASLPMDASTVDLTVSAPRVVYVEYTVGRESIRPALERGSE